MSTTKDPTTDVSLDSVAYPDESTQRLSREIDGRVFQRYAAIIRRLRADDGCPWDRKQTLESLRHHLIEESFEAVTAIDSLGSTSGSIDEVAEELGDTLLVVMLMASILETRDGISISALLDRNAAKLIRRHPHVFGDVTVDSVDDVIRTWNKVKTDVEGKTASLDLSTGGLPPLIRAVQMQKKAAKHAFDWDSLPPVFDKLREEIGELEELLPTGNHKAGHELQRRLEEEIGDILFSVVNLARKLDVDPTLALNRTNHKFAKRFSFIRNRVEEDGKNMNDLTLDELDQYWNQAKLTQQSTD